MKQPATLLSRYGQICTSASLIFAFAVAASLTLPATSWAADGEVTAVDLDEIFAGEAPESLEELQAMEAHIQELVERVVPCTVGLRMSGSEGSGVIVSADGYVLTAAHVPARAGRHITFVLHDGSTVSGRSMGLCHRIDSGLAKITDAPPEGGWPHVQLGNSEFLRRGEWVLATGHPGGYEPGREPVVRLGRILSSRPTVLRTDCTLVGGDSGGPLFDMEGNVVGIHSRIGGTLTSNMHVPVDTYRDTWSRLEDGETWGEDDDGSPFVGIVGKDDTAGPAEVVEVVRESPAEVAGVQAGDLILTIEGVEVTSLMRMMSISAGYSPGDTVTLGVRRDGEEIELEMEIGRRG